jgi:hypothetical protein
MIAGCSGPPPPSYDPSGVTFSDAWIVNGALKN